MIHQHACKSFDKLNSLINNNFVGEHGLKEFCFSAELEEEKNIDSPSAKKNSVASGERNKITGKDGENSIGTTINAIGKSAGERVGTLVRSASSGRNKGVDRSSSSDKTKKPYTKEGRQRPSMNTVISGPEINNKKIEEEPSQIAEQQVKQ